MGKYSNGALGDIAPDKFSTDDQWRQWLRDNPSKMTPEAKDRYFTKPAAEAAKKNDFSLPAPAAAPAPPPPPPPPSAEQTTYLEAMQRQKQFLDQLTPYLQQGGRNLQNVFEQQQGVANQLSQQAMGRGPNPALAQLALTTGQNVRNQAALMGSQRGARANPALVARQAANVGSQIQQQSAGQASALRAEQILAAQQALGSQLGQMGGTAGQQLNYMQSGIGMLGQMGLGGRGQSLDFQSNLDRIAAQERISAADRVANEAIARRQQETSIIGNLFGAAGSVATMGFGGKSHGGKIEGQAEVPGDSPQNDTVPAMLSPGEVVIPRSAASDQEKIASFLNSLLGTNLRAA